MATSQGDPFYSAKRRLARAKKHATDLEATTSGFIKGNPYTRIIEPEDDGVTQVHKIKLTQPFPGELSDITSDALDNLRSVLDHAAYGAAIASGVESPQYAYFPFSNSAENLRNRAKGLCKDLPSDISSLFCSFKPYKGGNYPLWALNEIRGANQHALLVPLGTASVNFTLNNLKIVAPKDGAVSFNLPTWTPSTWDSAKNEMIIARVSLGGTLDYEFKISPFIAFNDVPRFAGEPVLGVLSYLIREVERILMATEAECRRLGLVP